MNFIRILCLLFSTVNCLAEVNLNLLMQMQNDLLEKLKSKKVTCSEGLNNLSNGLEFLLIKKNNLHLKNQGLNLQYIQLMFIHRLNIKQHVNLQDVDCQHAVRRYFYAIRSMQDFLYLTNYQNEQVKIKDFDFKKMSTPDITNPKLSLLNPYIKDYQIRAGDIMIAKGISFTSSTISQLPTQPSHFSHIALFVEHESKIKTIEAYIGKGVDTYDFEEALKNENIRILILRPKDSSLALKSSQAMVDKYDQFRKINEKIKYDYELNLQDHSRLTCAEVAIDAYEAGSEKKIILPEFRSEIKMKNEEFIKKLGLKNGSSMFPADMELDTRFDTILEWTNTNLIQDSVRKDEIIKKVLNELNENKPAIQESLKASALNYLWKTRDITWLWPITAQILGLSVDFDADVPIETLKLSLNLEKTGQDYLNQK